MQKRILVNAFETAKIQFIGGYLKEVISNR